MELIFSILFFGIVLFFCWMVISIAWDIIKDMFTMLFIWMGDEELKKKHEEKMAKIILERNDY